MKRLCVVFILLLAVFACEEDDKNVPLFIQLSSEDSSVVIDPSGTSAFFTISAAGGAVVFKLNTNITEGITVYSEGNTWCDASLSGDVFVVTVSKLIGEEERSCKMQILYGTEVKATISIMQTVAPRLALSKEEVRFSDGGGSEQVMIRTNQAKWEVINEASWLTTEKKDTVLTLTAVPNNSGEELTATVMVKAGEGIDAIEAVITVIQSSGSMILEYTLPLAEATIKLPFENTFKATVDWGDGTKEEYDLFINPLSTPAPTHTYAEKGVYYVSISGTAEKIYSVLGYTTEMNSYITGVKQWGNLGLTSLEDGFFANSNLKYIADNPGNAFTEVVSFKNAFKNCVALEAVPAGLFKNCAKLEDVSFCFTGCTSLTKFPERLFKDCPAITNFGSFSSSNTALLSIPADLFAYSPEALSFSNIFSTCTALTEIPGDLFKNSTKATKFDYCFYGCKKLERVPAGLYANCAAATTFISAFFGCEALEIVEEGVFTNCTAVTSYKWLFANCKQLKTVPVNIFDNSRGVTDFSGTLRDCESLTGESPYTRIGEVKVHLYERSMYTTDFTAPKNYSTCFRNCTRLSDYATIEASYVNWTK